MWIQVQELKVELRDQAEVESVIAELEKSGFKGSIRGMLGSLEKDLKLSRGNLPIDIFEENLFDHDDADLLGEFIASEDAIFVFQPLDGSVRLWTFSLTTGADSEKIWTAIKAAIRAKIDGRRLKANPLEVTEVALPSSSQSGMFDDDAPATAKNLTVVRPEYEESEKHLAEAMSSDSIRNPILKIAQSFKVRATDLKNDFSDATLDAVRATGLVDQQFLVLCRKDSHQITEISNPDDLDSGSGGRLKCAVCNRDFKDELRQEIFSMSSHGKKLISGSRWMSIWVTEMLIDSGIPKDQISWNAVSSSDEIDIVVEIFGKKIFFELKDREFGLGDAYPFAFRCGRYKADHGIVIALPSISPEANAFLKEHKQSPTMFTIDGSSSVKIQLKNTLRRLMLRSAAQQFGGALSAYGPRFRTVFSNWVNQRTSAPA